MSYQYHIPVEFGGVSIGDATARIGIRIDRTDLNSLLKNAS